MPAEASTHGGTTARHVATSARIDEMASWLRASGVRWHYARVDAIALEGALHLMELELIEPSLFLLHGGRAAERLADGIVSFRAGVGGDAPCDMTPRERPGPETGAMSNGRELARPRDDRVIGGVCAGIARYFGWSAQRTRIGYVVLSILSAAFPGMLVYLVLWFLMPETGAPARRRFELEEPRDR